MFLLIYTSIYSHCTQTVFLPLKLCIHKISLLKNFYNFLDVKKSLPYQQAFIYSNKFINPFPKTSLVALTVINASGSSFFINCFNCINCLLLKIVNITVFSLPVYPPLPLNTVQPLSTSLLMYSTCLII